MSSLAARVLLAPIRLYQRYISPGLPANCRYYPTCSAYAVEALQQWGAIRGSWLAIRRLGRCQPWSKRPHIDLVPIREPRPGARSSTQESARISGATFAPESSLSFQDAHCASPTPDHGSRVA